MSKKRLKPNGFTLSEALLALMVYMLITMLMVGIFQTGAGLARSEAGAQKQFAILQLRQILASSAEITLNGDEVNWYRGTDKYRLMFHNSRLVIRPGYQILMENVDGKFTRKQDHIYLFLDGRSYQLS